MTPKDRKRFAGVVLVLTAFALTGCVRRSLTIRTEPDGALVYLNDEEVGRSPVTTDFLWYGDYEIIVRRDGYQTLRTHERINPPWYQVPPVDFFAEVLYVGRLHDQRFVSYTLEPEQLPGRGELLERAAELRSQALSEEH
jgi:hypothetical protein